MPCARCAGLRVPEIIYEGGLRVHALRCLQCGDITDTVIARNRGRQRYPRPGRARTPIYGSNRWRRSKIVPS